MPIKNHNCIYECNKGVRCMCTDCNGCLCKPDNTFNEEVKGDTALSNPYDDSNWDGE